MHRIQAFEVNEEGKIIKLAFHELETEKIDAPSPAKTAKEVGALIYSTFLAGDYDGYAAVHSSGFSFLFWFPSPCSLSLHITHSFTRRMLSWYVNRDMSQRLPPLAC